MKILIIGSGAREYALGLALSADKDISHLYFAPGNGATEKLGTNLAMQTYEDLANFAMKNDISFSIVGPEEPLVNGIVDIFEASGLKIFGPNKKAAKLEGSKVYMKEFLHKNHIKTAKSLQTSDLNKACEFIDTLSVPVVLKADGLCAGKGVLICQSHQNAKEEASSMLNGKSFGEAGKNIVIEEFLDGFEISMFAVCDGKDFKLFPATQDHKKLLDEDKGPNTGGMGAYAPVPFVGQEIYEKVKKEVLAPTLQGLKNEGVAYKGVLFLGLMICKDDIYVLEYNVRFGDPECEVLMPLVKSNLKDLFLHAINGTLEQYNLEFFDKFCVGVVMASQNYPYKSSPKTPIICTNSNMYEMQKNGHFIFGGVEKQEDCLLVNGGRVMLSIGMGENILQARNNAYELAKNIDFQGRQMRLDIAYQALK